MVMLKVESKRSRWNFRPFKFCFKALCIPFEIEKQGTLLLQNNNCLWPLGHNPQQRGNDRKGKKIKNLKNIYIKTIFLHYHNPLCWCPHVRTQCSYRGGGGAPGWTSRGRLPGRRGRHRAPRRAPDPSRPARRGPDGYQTGTPGMTKHKCFRN